MLSVTKRLEVLFDNFFTDILDARYRLLYILSGWAESKRAKK